MAMQQSMQPKDLPHSEILTRVFRELIIDFQTPQDLYSQKLLEKMLDYVYRDLPEEYLKRTKPSWLTANILQKIQDDFERQITAHGVRNQKNSKYIGQTIAKCGADACNLAFSRDFVSWMRSNTGIDLGDSRDLCYLQYDREGDYIDIHFDTTEFAAGFLLCVDHKFPETGQPSSTVVVRPDGKIEYLNLLPGEALLFIGSGIPHGRTPIKRGELVRMMIVGFPQNKSEYQSITY